MSKLIEEVLNRLRFVNQVEHKPASYDDLRTVEIDGKLHKINYGTLRNLLSILKKEGKIERYYNSRASFFVLKGVKFGKQRTINVMSEFGKSQLSEVIQQLPEESEGLHDIHTSFKVPDIWTILSESKRFKIDEHNKGILLPYFNIDGLKITAIVHHTDTVTVTVACSKNPVTTKIDDANGIIRLAAALARTQERIQRTADECGNSLPGGYENILIPDSGTWMFTMLHIGVDTPSYREANICLTWKDAQGVLLREYSKKKEEKLRRERQEYSRKSLAEAGRKFFNDGESAAEMNRSPNGFQGL